MKKIVVGVLVVFALAWSVYAAISLVQESGSHCQPSSVFGPEDGSVLVIQRQKELKNSPVFQQFKDHPLIASVSSVNWKGIGALNVYISANRPIIISEKNTSWTQSDLNEIKAYFKQNNIQIERDGKFLIIHQLDEVPQQESKSLLVKNKDKNASGILFDFNSMHEKWEKAEIYALPDDYFEYRSASMNLKVGKPIRDIEIFSAVLPKNIERYHFYDKFYYKEKDSIFNAGVMLDWLDIGFVKAVYQGQTILVSDYRAQQIPRLVLLEKAIEDSIQQMGDITSFSGFQLTSFFPNNENDRFYVVEIEDKTIFTEDKSLAQDIVLQYNLGETLLLNETIANNFFGGLPNFANERKITPEENTSITIRNNLKVEVVTVPIHSERSLDMADSWTRTLAFDEINFIVSVPDHIRGGNSFFVATKTGEYVLLNGQNGGVIWSGHLEEPIRYRPQVIDLFENDKHQILIVSENSIHLLDLNGESVNGFPYTTSTNFTSNISSLKWKNSMQFVIGNSKGEVTLINNQGQELNVIQLSTHGIKKGVFAKNVQGNLRVFGIDSEDFAHLGYLETNAAPQRLGKIRSNIVQKVGSQIKGISSVDNNISLWNSNEINKEQALATGKFISADDKIIFIQKNNILQSFDWNGRLQTEITLGFSEINNPKFIRLKSAKILVVMDYLTNKIHAISEYGESLEGFPKEGRKILEVTKNENQLQIVTTINDALVGYLIKI